MPFYRALLRLFPASFRNEYGDDMSAVFARELREATGLLPRVALWMRTIGDVAVNAGRVHFDILRQDVKYAVRSLRRTPGFTVTAIGVAALGIGATTATFSIADHVLLRPLPFADPDGLVKLTEDHTSLGYPRMEPSPPNYRDWKRMASSFESVEAFNADTASLVGSGEPERVMGSRVAGGVFRLLGRQASIGRTLGDGDVSTETQNPVVISDRLWRTRFAADANVLGRTLTLDQATLVVVGVMPPDFHFPARGTDFWRVLRFNNSVGDDDRGNHYLQVMARLRPGVSFEQARSEMRVIGDQIAQQYPKEQAGTSVNVQRWRDEVGWQNRMILWGLVGASLCVLLIACTNLANLLLSRALARRGELAVRAAVGASVDRLVRQMLTDSLLLSGLGGLLGVLMAIAVAPMVVRLVPSALPIAEVPPIDVRMLLVAALVTLSTGVLFGVLPAVRVSRNTDSSALKDGARGGTSRGTEQLRSALVVAEIVASVILLVSAGLLIQALMKVQAIDPGFRSANVLTLKTMLPRPKYSSTVSRLQFYRQVIDDTQALPGVQRAAYVSFTPFTMRGGVWEVLTTTPDPGSPGGFVAPQEPRRASLRIVTPGYFDTIGIPILQGRDISTTDTIDTPSVAIVSQSFARYYFPDQDPIGRSFGFAFNVRTIVGVAGDIRFRGLERADNEPQVYLAAAQQRDNQIGFYAPQDLIVRSSVPPDTLMPAVRAIVRKADPQLPITNMRTLDDVVALETAPRVIQLRVLGAFAMAAFLLAAIGIHGLLAFTVSARSREIGVRIALGARSGDILRIVIGRSALLAGIGVTIGVALAYATGRSIQALLAGVDPSDLTVFAAAALLAVVMTLAGSLLPALRAVRTDPLTATRAE
jgi:putative ABC transport system permease protein